MKKILFVFLCLISVSIYADARMTAIVVGQVTPAAAPAGISDDFSSDTSENYTTIGSYGISISGGVAYGAENYQTNLVYHETATGSNDHYVQVKGYMPYGGVVLRSNGTTGYAAYATSYGNPAYFKLYSFNGGTLTEVAAGESWQSAGNMAADSTFNMKVAVSGSTFTLYVDEGSGLVSRGTKTDSTYSTGQYVGLVWYRVPGANPSLDDFSGGL